MQNLNIPEHVKNQAVQKHSFQTPTEIVELPSKGLIYPTENPLHSGQVEIFYPETPHEEILLSKK